MSRIVFSQAARADRRAITAHTVERFGIAQARQLRASVARTLDTLSEAPGIGHPRPELDPPGRSFRYLVVMRRFIIVYEPADTGIRVVRILHGMRNLAAELDRDSGQGG